MRIDGIEFQLQFVLRDLGEIEQIVNQLALELDIATDHGQRGFGFRGLGELDLQCVQGSDHGVSGVRNSCESMARKLSLVRFAASTAAFCCAMAAWARLRSAIAADNAIAVMVSAAVQACSIRSD